MISSLAWGAAGTNAMGNNWHVGDLTTPILEEIQATPGSVN